MGTQAVYAALSASLSPDAAAQRPAEAALLQWEAQPGFVAALTARRARSSSLACRLSHPLLLRAAPAQEILSTPGAAPGARLAASLCLKNAVNRQWRPQLHRAGIADAEKAALRDALLNLALAEAEPSVRLQLALSAARVARFDFPRAWPGLFDRLAGELSPQSPTASRAALLLHHCLKELASKRLAGDARAFEAVAAALCPLVLDRFSHATASLLAAHDAASLDHQTIADWGACTKALRRLAVGGGYSDAKSFSPCAPAAAAAPRVAAALHALRRFAVLDGSDGSDGSDEPADPRAKCCVRLSKALHAIMAAHPYTFAQCGALHAAIATAVHDLTGGAVASPDSAAAPFAFGAESSASASPSHRPLAPQLLAAHARLLVAALGCPQYRPPPPPPPAPPPGAPPPPPDAASDAARERPLRSAASTALSALLPLPTLLALGGAVLGSHMRLTKRDADAWEADAEAFAIDEASEDVSLLRPAAASLLVAVLSRDRAAVAPHLVSAMQSRLGATPLCDSPGDAQSVVSHRGGRGASLTACLSPREAAAEGALSALAACAYELHDHLDFASWWTAALRPLLWSRCDRLRALRRRAALCAAALAASLPDAARPPVYEALAALLAPCHGGGGDAPASAHLVPTTQNGADPTTHSVPPDPDVAVRLAAAAALRALVDDWAWEAEAFGPHAPRSLAGLFALAGECSHAESASAAFGAAAVILERLGEGAAPAVGALLPSLPGLWRSACAAHNTMLRMQLLGACASVCAALGPLSPGAWGVVLPIIADAAGQQRNTNSSAVLQQNSQSPSFRCEPVIEDALAAWRCVVRHAPDGSGGHLLPLLPLALDVLSSSWEHAPVLCRILVGHILLDPGGALAAVGPRLAAILASSAGECAPPATQSLLTVAEAVMVAYPDEGGALLSDALVAWLRSAVCGTESDEAAQAICALWGRLLLANPSRFGALVSAASAAGVGRGDALLAWADCWLLRVGCGPAASAPRRRRLAALCFCALLASGHPLALSRLDEGVGCVGCSLEEAACAADDAASERPAGPDGYQPEDWASWAEAGGEGGEEGAEGGRRQAAAECDAASPQRADVKAAWTAAWAAAGAAHGAGAVRSAAGRVGAEHAQRLARFVPL